MKTGLILILTYLIGVTVNGQTCQQEEIKIRYTNGFGIFNVCKSNPQISYDEKKEYYWYTEFSKIKSTKGGCGGNLLNGNYKFYDKQGNLREDKNYYLGLPDGNTVIWDSLGNITSKTTYEKGKITYWKFLNENNYWIEFNGPVLEEGTVRKVYNKYETLISEKKMLADFKQHVKIYYEYPAKQLKEEYTKSAFLDDMTGKYTAYYENGKLEVEGQFYEGDYLFHHFQYALQRINIKVGKWKWYNKDGTLDSESDYKAEVTYWPNGEIKMAGGLILDTDTNEWVRIGEWRWYTEDGKFDEKKEYRWGVEINE